MLKSSAADEECRRGDILAARLLYKEAYELEAEAAKLIAVTPESEPTRSILYLSAASLAAEAKEFNGAIKLIADGLRGFPPLHIEEDLKDLYEKVNYENHLRVRGVVLEDKDMQLSLQGKDIGFGFAPYVLFEKRIKNIDALIKRTYQRKLSVPYQDQRKTMSTSPLTTALSIPRAASFAISIRLLRQVDEKKSLPLPFGGSSAEDILNEVVLGLEILNEGNEAELKKLIPDESYCTHFMVHAREIAPDGERVSLVGLTTKRRRVALQRPKKSYNVIRKINNSMADNVPRWLEFEGYLDYASKKESRVGLSTKDGREYFVVVTGGMEDFVRANFGKQVVVKGHLTGNEITPEDIVPIDEA